MTERILVAIDGSARSNRAIKVAARYARALRGKLVLFHATDTYRPPPYTEGYFIEWPSSSVFLKESQAAATRLLARAKKLAAAQKVSAVTLQARSGSPAQAILAAARKQRATLVVMASHGRTGLEKLLLGSETQRVLAYSKIPVLVVR